MARSREVDYLPTGLLIDCYPRRNRRRILPLNSGDGQAGWLARNARQDLEGGNPRIKPVLSRPFVLSLVGRPASRA